MNDATTRELRDTFRKLCAAATPGPWEYLGPTSLHDGLVLTQHPDHAPAPFNEANNQICDMLGNQDRSEPNAALIVFIRNKALALLDALDALDAAEAENARLRSGPGAK